MARYKIIVNPIAGRGRGARAADEIKQIFERSGSDYDLVETAKAGDAIALARQAVGDGYDILVAVGGDGTTQEVINGLLSNNKGANCQLAIIPVGSGNDFAAAHHIPMNIAEACELVLHGKARPVDIGRLRINHENERYFDNTVGIGLDGLVNIEAHRIRGLRGLPLYLAALLKTVFISLKPFRIEMVVDGVSIIQPTLMVTIANGKREGGGFIMAPLAELDDGYLDLIYTKVLSRLRVLRIIPLFIKGTHVGHPAICNRQAQHITIKSEDPMYLHADGEIPCEVAHDIEVEVIPGGLQLISS